MALVETAGGQTRPDISSRRCLAAIP